MNLDRLLKKIKFKSLVIKSSIFLLIWLTALILIELLNPNLIDWTKFVTAMMANTLTFLVAYVLTVIGYRYNKSDRNKR